MAKVTEKQLREIRNEVIRYLYEQKRVPPAVIAEVLSIKVSYLYRILDRMGIERTTRSYYPSEENIEMYELHKNGMSYSQIGEKFNIDPYLARDRIKRCEQFMTATD